MSIWILAQAIVNLILMIGLCTLWLRMRRPPKDDPRLSRGLQLLQSKIAVLEDLSDRTDRQVDQMVKLLDNKTRQIQSKFVEAERHLQKLKSSMDRSMEVAAIFQDKIPHDEIIERQTTIKHVQAARLANQGCSVEEILSQIDLPREQVEFIAKVNRDQLMFDEDQLPAWIETDPAQHSRLTSALIENGEISEDREDNDFEFLTSNEISGFPLSTPQYSSLKKLGDEFRQACRSFDESQIVGEAPSSKKTLEKVAEKFSESLTLQKAIDMKESLLRGVSDSLNPLLEVIQPHKVSESEIAREPKPQSDQRMASDPKSSHQAPSLSMNPAGVAKKSTPSGVTVVASEPSKFGGTKKLVQDVDIKRVVFPRIDMNDNLS